MSAVVRFELGSLGWDYPQWTGGFYPDDMPADWRLIYYANEFGCVLVPEEQWLDAAEDEWEGWEDDPPEGFRFFLAVDGGRFVDADYIHRLKACIRALGGKFASLVDMQGQVERPAGPEGVELLKAVDASELVEGRSSGFALLLTDAGLGSLREQRSVLESIAAKVPGEAEIPLFLVGDPPRPESLRTLKQVAELLGVA